MNVSLWLGDFGLVFVGAWSQCLLHVRNTVHSLFFVALITWIVSIF